MTKKIVAHFTDTHLGQKLIMGGTVAGDEMRYDDEPEEHKDHLRSVLDDIAHRGISDVIFGGDIGTNKSVHWFFELLNGYNFTTAIILGNHDTYGNVAQYCGLGANAVQGKMCFSGDDGHLKRILLDSSDNTVGDDQLAWLARELDGASKVALFLHHPILEIDTPLERSGATLRDRDKIRMLLGGADCDVSVFCGHYHMIDEAHEANIRQFVTPAVSYQIIKQADRLLVDTSTFGYRILEIDGAEISTEVVLLTEAS
jgi:3',5'-cyclic-AMP phosphodiesterase